MQIYRRCRISLAYISCFRLRYGRSRMWKNSGGKRGEESGKGDRGRRDTRERNNKERAMWREQKRVAPSASESGEPRFFAPVSDSRSAIGEGGGCTTGAERIQGREPGVSFPVLFMIRARVARGGQRCRSGSHRCANEHASCFSSLSSLSGIFAPRSGHSPIVRRVLGEGHACRACVLFLCSTQVPTFPQLGEEMDRFSDRFPGSVHLTARTCNPDNVDRRRISRG